MKVNRFSYYIKQSSKSFRQNKLMSIASVTTTFAALFILGIFLLLTLNINHWVDDFSRNCQIQVFISDDLNEQEYDALGSRILRITSVERVEKYTKEQIFEEMRIKLKDKANILDGLEDDNPFRNSYKITLSDLSNTKSVIEQLETIQAIEAITDFQESATLVVKVGDTLKTFSFWLMILLFAISAFIVSNSIKVSLYARRREINIMKYIGATDWFIRWPFVIEGIIIGIWGAILCFATIWLAYTGICTKIPTELFTPLPFSAVWIPLIIAFILVGIIIGALGSILSIRKHLKV